MEISVPFSLENQQVAEIQTGFAPVNNTQLYYEMQGQGDPLVLLHAGLVDCRMWDEQFAALAEHYRVIRFDAQGFGQSAVANGRYAHYQNLAALLDYLTLPPAHLLGCSLGGRAVLDCALEYPHLVRSLICVDTGMSGYHFVDPFVQTTGEEIGQALAAGDVNLAAEWIVRAWFDGPQRTPQQAADSVRQKVLAMTQQQLRRPDEDTSGAYEVTPPAIERLAQIKVPTLAVVGECDASDIQAMTNLIEQQVPGAQKATIANAGHLANMERPQQFNKLILDWLAQVP